MHPSESMERISGLVSVVIPAYNAEGSLRRCIESVLGQTHKFLEVIVINDGSIDGTETIAQTYGDQIRYVYQENKGETSARNTGFAMARGEFITFLDHDDHWHLEFVKTCVEFLHEHPEAIAVSVGSEHQTALKDTPITTPSFLSESSAMAKSSFLIENFFEFWARHNHICAGSAMLRGSLIDKAGGQRSDIVLSGDIEYWAYLATFGKWGFIPRVLLFVDGTQITRGNLYQKFYNRYSHCSSVENWEARVTPRLKAEDISGFKRVRGRVATWYIFAKVFVRRDSEAFLIAQKYKNHLEGRVGSLWRMGLIVGKLSWKFMCVLVRFRIRVQYYLRDKKL